MSSRRLYGKLSTADKTLDEIEVKIAKIAEQETLGKFRAEESVAIEDKICDVAHGYMVQAVNDHTYMHMIGNGDFSVIPQGICEHSMSDKIPPSIVCAIMDVIHPALPMFLQDALEASKTKPYNKMTNLEFICGISYSRDWFDDCPICFESMFCKKCVHRHATIFRPCGHAMCSDCSSTFTTCPTCKSHIASRFSSAGDIALPESMYGVIFEKVPIIMREYYRSVDMWEKLPVKKITLQDIVSSQLKVKFDRSAFRCGDDKFADD